MPTLLTLPLELLESIASNLSQRNLSAFIRSHRHFYLSLTAHLYQYNKRHHGGSALIWGVQHSMLKTVQYSIQQNFNLETRSQSLIRYGQTALRIAIGNVDYAMVKLLVENGAEINETDIIAASYRSCRGSIWDDNIRKMGAFL